MVPDRLRRAAWGSGGVKGELDSHDAGVVVVPEGEQAAAGHHAGNGHGRFAVNGLGRAHQGAAVLVVEDLGFDVGLGARCKGVVGSAVKESAGCHVSRCGVEALASCPQILHPDQPCCAVISRTL